MTKVYVHVNQDEEDGDTVLGVYLTFDEAAAAVNQQARGGGYSVDWKSVGREGGDAVFLNEEMYPTGNGALIVVREVS